MSIDSTAIAGQAKGYAQLPVGNVTAAGLPFIPPGTRFIRIRPEAQAIRWRDDGTDPTPLLGYPLSAEQELIYSAAQMSAFRFIGQAGGALVNFAFYG